MTPERPAAAFCLTVDVEEWYHTCLVPALVDPSRRPAGLAEELDFLLPELLELLAQTGATATFFVLGEVARRLPARIREIAAAGHEVASHNLLHLRAGELSPAEFLRQASWSRALLEDLVSAPVTAFRAPEWSLRQPDNPRLVALAEAGYEVDSSLAPFVGAGRWSNPRLPYRIRVELPGPAFRTLLELPPLVFGGPARLPAGSWTGRLVPPRILVAAARRTAERGGLPVFVVHPWEVSGRPTPDRLPGFAGFVHETGRRGYRERFTTLLRSLPWQSLALALRDRPVGCDEPRYTLRAEDARIASGGDLAAASRLR